MPTSFEPRVPNPKDGLPLKYSCWLGLSQKMSQWLGTQSLQRNYHERTQCAHYVFALSNLVHNRFISLGKRTPLFLKDLGRSLIHDVDNTVDLVQCLPWKNLHGESPEARRTNANKSWKKFSRQRHFEYRWPEVLVNPHP